MLDLQELAIINAMPPAYNLRDRTTIAFLAQNFLKDPRFDERVANSVIDRMIQNKLLEKVRSYIGVTGRGRSEYMESTKKLRELAYQLI